MNLPGSSNVDICLTNQFPFLKEEEEGSHGGQAAQLSQAKQGSGGLAESRPPHADVCTGNCWHHLVGWEPLQRASEINDSLTSTSGASLCLQSRAFRSISRLKGMERCSAKQQKCPYWVPGAQTIVAFFRFLQPTLCPQGLSL